ncbi:uncharacterized protein LOC118557716 [Fundulus heteroclitus]|uniref:uncharacterized protein LOC118557716 n=1 Tax=Fundulus heteroclitus TaxID=8078 RepID=UPI00165CE594|nr:uncharacterized protein LOC118557716 [Fundulus heteroclitus]
MVDKFISDKISAMMKVNYFISKEKESELKMVDRFISEEVLGVSKDKKSELKMMNTSITEEPSEVKEIKKIISKQRLQTQDISEDIIEPCKNQGLNDRAVPVITAKQQNKGVGVKIKTFLQKYSQRRYKRVAPQQSLAVKEEPSEEETDVAGLKQSVSEEQTRDILRAVSGKTGWSQADRFILLDLKDSNVEKATLSLCKEKILKTAEKPILKRVFSFVGKALSKPFKKS